MIDADLKSFFDRIERLQGEKDALSEDIKEVYAEAKSSGYEPAIMRKVIAERKMDAAKLDRQERMIETYKAALGMLAETPLGQAAVSREAAHA